MKNKIGLDMTGLDDLIRKLEPSRKELRELAEKSLIAAHETITPKLKEGMKRHRRTGTTEATIIETPKVEWEGDMARVGVGFDISGGGLPSVFLLYGTPRKDKDQKLYNAFFGTATKKEVAKKQREIFEKAIAKKLGGGA